MAIERQKQQQQRSPSREAGMHVCPSCDAPFLQPDGWTEAGPSHWHVNLFCPNCDWSGNGVFNDTAIERFDRELDKGAEEMLADLQQLTHAVMSDYVETFVEALRSDQILPEDF
jgi:hypothetical protein